MGINLKQIEQDIKEEKMMKVCEEYCDSLWDKYGNCDRDNCIIAKNGCCELDDAFDSNPELLEKAYKVVTSSKDMVNNPSHYTNGGMECIDEMILVFGKLTVANFCLCNAWKYRYRALYKNGEEDMKKSHWYIKKYKELVEDEFN